jgi:hypothetical protein
MHQCCKECTARQGEGPVDKQTITSISLSKHNALFEALAAGLQAEQTPLAAGASGFSRLAATPGLIAQIHTTPDGGVFASAAVPTANGLGAKVRLTGSIGLTPSVLTLAHTIDYQGKAVAVTLTVEQPIKVEQTWHFNFAGVTPLPNGNYSASSLELDTTKTFLSSQFSLDQRCVNNCGGQAGWTLLGVCLLSLIAGPEAYVACVIAGLGPAAVGIAVCAAYNCVRS